MTKQEYELWKAPLKLGQEIPQGVRLQLARYEARQQVFIPFDRALLCPPDWDLHNQFVFPPDKPHPHLNKDLSDQCPRNFYDEDPPTRVLHAAICDMIEILRSRAREDYDAVEALAAIAGTAIEVLDTSEPWVVGEVAGYHPSWPVMVSPTPEQLNKVKHRIEELQVGAGCAQNIDKRDLDTPSVMYAIALLDTVRRNRLLYQERKLDNSTAAGLSAHSPKWYHEAGNLPEFNKSTAEEWWSVAKEAFLEACPEPWQLPEWKKEKIDGQTDSKTRQVIIDLIRQSFNRLAKKTVEDKIADGLPKHLKKIHDLWKTAKGEILTEPYLQENGIYEPAMWCEKVGNLPKFTKDSALQWWKYAEEFLCSPLFSAGDIINSSWLAKKLKNQSEPLSKFLWAQFSEKSKQILESIMSSSEERRSVFVEELNKVLHGNAFYTTKLFEGAKLSTEALILKKRKPKGEDMVRFHRLLLEDSYPQEIIKNLFLREHLSSGKSSPATNVAANESNLHQQKSSHTERIKDAFIKRAR